VSVFWAETDIMGGPAKTRKAVRLLKKIRSETGHWKFTTVP
jgi:hypothetical protein